MKINLIKRYTELRPQYQTFSTKINSLIEELLRSAGIHVHLIESRTKEFDSFKEKLKRKKEAYHSLSDMTDLSGLRVIVYYPEDIEKVIKLIRSEFEIDEKNSIVKGDEFNSNEFGYKSFHIVFNISKNRTTLSEWRQYNDFKCEIQIRTVLQHAWASISHTLQYKTTHDIPKSLQRKLFRLAGLFELADEQFSEINKAHLILVSQIQKENIETSKRDLNLLSMEQLIAKSTTVKKIYDIALKVGFTDRLSGLGQVDNNEVDTISDVITLCEHFQIESIMSLEKTIKSISPVEIEAYFEKQIKTDRDKGEEWFVSSAFILILLLLKVFSQKVDVNMLTKMGWDEEIARRVIKNL